LFYILRANPEKPYTPAYLQYIKSDGFQLNPLQSRTFMSRFMSR